MKTQLKVTRIAHTRSDNGSGPTNGTGISTRRLPTARLLYQGLGGAGGRVITHLKALDRLDNQTAGYLWKDSDRGDRFETTLPGDRRVACAESEICRFGVEDGRSELENYPQLARRYRRLLRGIPVAATYGHGAGQWRPIGALDYELDITTIHTATLRALDTFYLTPPARRMTMQQILAEREAEAQREQPLLVLQVSSAVGGLGSSIFVQEAYYTRHLLAKRGATNVAVWGVLLGPRAFHGRGPNIPHNFAALMRELDAVYHNGFRHTFINGETVVFARPPFDLLFQVDLTEWPEGEDPGDKLSDTATDSFLRETAIGIHLLTAPAMRDRLLSLFINTREEEDLSIAEGRLGFLSSFSAALATANLEALEEALALHQAETMLHAWSERC